MSTVGYVDKTKLNYFWTKVKNYIDTHGGGAHDHTGDDLKPNSVTIGGHDSAIGTIKSVSTSNTQLSGNSWVQCSNSMSLSTGKWIVYASATFPSTGTTNVRKGIEIFANGSQQQLSKQIISQASAGQCTLLSTIPIDVTASSTSVYSMIFHSSSNQLTITDILLSAIRIA